MGRIRVTPVIPTSCSTLRNRLRMLFVVRGVWLRLKKTM